MIKYQDKNGVIHACEGDTLGISNDMDTYCLWTKCGEMDVPANKGFKSKEKITCRKCLEEINS